MSKSLGNHIGVTDPPGGDVRRTMRIPDEQIAPWFSLLLGAEPPRGPRARATRSAPSRARSWSASTRRTDAVEAEAAFDRLFIAHELPEEIEEVGRRRRRRAGAPARGDRRGLRADAERRAAGDRPGRRASSTASRWPPDVLDLPGRGAGRAGAAGRQAPVPAPAGRRACRGRGRCYSPRPLRSCSVRPCAGPSEDSGGALHSTRRSGRTSELQASPGGVPSGAKRRDGL